MAHFDLINKIDDIKEKLSDSEYLEIMNTIASLKKEQTKEPYFYTANEQSSELKLVQNQDYKIDILNGYVNIPLGVKTIQLPEPITLIESQYGRAPPPNICFLITFINPYGTIKIIGSSDCWTINCEYIEKGWTRCFLRFINNRQYYIEKITQSVL